MKETAISTARILQIERAPVIGPPVPLHRQHETAADRRARGRTARLRVSRECHAGWSPPADRPDPVALLEEQAATWAPELKPVRFGRMLASPLAFFRGAAAIMAADLALTPRSGFDVQLCGDASVANFGGFAWSSGDVVFDIKDFDETLPGPWEWDVKRLAASIHIAGRMRACDDEDCEALVMPAVSAYRSAMQDFAEMPFLAVRHSRLDMTAIVKRSGRGARSAEHWASGKRGSHGQPRDQIRFTAKSIRQVHSKWRIAGHPSAVPVEEIYPKSGRWAVEEVMRSFLRSLKQSMNGDARLLLDNFEYAHMAQDVSGMEGLGRRSWIVLLIGRDYEEPLFLQVKEAQASSLEPYVPRSRYLYHGERIVAGQRLMQAQSDPLLSWGWLDGMPGDTARQYYVRQLRDGRVLADVEHMPLRELLVYGEICGWALARAHACSGDRIAISQYLGKGPAIDRAIADFARLYAHQNERDYQSLRKAVERGAVKARQGD